MAAIYSGIHLKLKSPQTAWEDKLKLARFAWISSQCLLPNKEQVLVDWCTHALSLRYNKKVEFSQEVLDGLWCYLDDVLHSRKLQSFLKLGKTLTLRLNMAQLLLERLQESARGDSNSVCVSILLSVCRGILSSPALSSVFTTKFELMADLLAKFCSLGCRELQRPLLTAHQVTESVIGQEEPISECSRTEPVAHLETTQAEQLSDSLLHQTDGKKAPHMPQKNLQAANVFEVLLQVLSCYSSVQRQQANQNRVFTMVTHQLLQPLVLLRHLLTSGDFTHSHAHLQLQLRKDIRLKIDSILQLALFPSELLALYREELLPAKYASGKRGSGGAKGPLKPVSASLSKVSAHGYCEPSLHYAVKSNTLSLLFKLFLERFGKVRGEDEEEQKMLCFYFLTRLVPDLDLHLEQRAGSPAEAKSEDSVVPQQKSPSVSPASPESWSLALLAVESLLSQTLSADIYNVAADRIRHGEVQLRFYRTLTQMLFNDAQPSIPSWYRCLKVLLNLNHLILEPDLDQLVSSAWVNAECIEARVQRARQLVVCSLLQTYSKLRQLPRFFSELLSVICLPALDDLRPPLLPEGIVTSLKACLPDIPPSQGLEICSLVLDSIRRFILPDLSKERPEVEKMETDREPTGQEKVDASLKLSTLTQLLHVVLFNLKTLDNTSPVPLVTQSRDMMENMQKLIQDLLHLLGTERSPESETGSLWEQQAQEAALLLQYTWVEVDTLFDIHCNKYTALDSTQAAVDAGFLSGEILLTDLPPALTCSSMSCLLLKLLTLQQMKKILKASSSDSAALLHKAAQSILAKAESEVRWKGEPIWDGQIGSVNESSYVVAHWYFVMSNLPLIIPHLSAEDVYYMADRLVSSVLRREKAVSKAQLPGVVTVSIISSELLQSSILAELPSVFSAIVHCLAQQIIHELKATQKAKDCTNFLMFQETETGVPERNSSFWTTLMKKETLLEDVVASSKTGKVSLLLSSTQTKELINILQILTKLNPDGMNSEDLSSVFLLLFFMLISTSSHPDQIAISALESESASLLLRKLLRTLTYFLEGKNLQSVLKVIHGATLLQATVSSLLRYSSSAKFEAASSADWLDLIEAMQDFIKSLVQLIIIRNSSVRLNLEQFTSYLTSVEIVSRKNAASNSGASVHLLLACLAAFSQAMTCNLGRNTLIDQTLTQMLTRTNGSLGPAVEFILKPQMVPQPASVLGQAFLVEVVRVMLHCELSSLSVKDKDKQRGTLTHMSLYQGFCQQIFRGISSAPRPMDFLVSCLHFLSTFYKAVEETQGGTDMDSGDMKKAGRDEVYIQILQNVQKLLKAPWLSEAAVSELEPAVQELLRHLVERSTTNQFNVLLMMIREGLDIRRLRAGNRREVLSAVIIIKLLSCCQLPETCANALWLIAPQIVSAMVCLVRASSQDISLTLPFTVPMVTSMTMLLRKGEGHITCPHHVAVVLGALQAVPLNQLTPEVYQSAFLAVHEALFAIIQCHPQVMLNAAPSFLNVFHRLVASIMQEGRQQGDSDTGADNEVHLQCSRLIERMYSYIAAAAESLTMLSAFMVAQYVTELQKVTLRPDVKLHLTEGIYCILDLCKEQDIKFLTVGLQMGVREVFNELYSSYTHYHKAQRQGEDKYTV